MMSDEARREFLLGLRQQVRNLEAQISFLLDDMAQEEKGAQEEGRRQRPATFGKREE